MTDTCVNCGIPLSQDDQFCSSCGTKRSIASLARQVYEPYSKGVTPMYAIEQTKSYIKMLGLVELAFGIVTLVIIAITAIMLSFLLSPEFLQSVGAEMPTDMHLNLNWLIGLVGVILLLIGISAVIDIIGGALLLKQKKAGKVITYISAILSIMNVPIGTAYAIGAFWILSRPETDQILR